MADRATDRQRANAGFVIGSSLLLLALNLVLLVWSREVHLQGLAFAVGFLCYGLSLREPPRAPRAAALRMAALAFFLAAAVLTVAALVRG